MISSSTDQQRSRGYPDRSKDEPDPPLENWHAVELDVVTHSAVGRDVATALEEIEALPSAGGLATAFPVVSDRGVPDLGWE